MSDPGRTSFGELLRELRAQARLSQEELAERARMSVAAISSLERGIRRNPYPSSVDLIAAGLGVGPNDRERLQDAAAHSRRLRSRGPGQSSDARGRLPTPINGFFGRDAEVEELTRLLAGRRLVTITGPGGIGKTRLAVEVAARHADSFKDGVSFVDLTAQQRGELVAAAVALTLGVSEQRQVPLTESILVALESSDALLLLDNCEHLIDGVAQLAVVLVARCPKLRILVTSREPLHVDGEAVVPVGPLAVEAAAGSGPLQSPAALLFLERTRDAGAPVDAAANSETIATICRRLDGMPLAIELAAARARSLSPAQLLSALDKRFAVLNDAGRGRIPRHRSLRATIDWSFALLSPLERTLFRRLAAFPGSWTIEGALAVGAPPLGMGDLLEVHGSLIERSLVQVVPTDGVYRYTLLETVREYGRDALEASGEAEAVGSALLSYAVGIVERCASAYWSANEEAALHEADLEYPLLRSALATACERADLAFPAHRLVQALCDYWLIRGATTEALEWTSRAMAMANAEPRVTARTQLVMARHLRISGEIPQALRLDLAAAETARACGDEVLFAEALYGRAADEQAAGNPAAADRTYADAVRVIRPLGSNWLLARALHSWGGIATLLGRLDEADRLLVESAALLTMNGDRRGLAWVEFRRGYHALVQHDLDTAETHARRSLALRRSIGDRMGIVSSLEQVGIIACERGRVADAVAAFDECLALARAHGFVIRLVEAAQRTAHLAFRLGRRGVAIELFRAAGAVRGSLGCPIERSDAIDMDDLIQAASSVRSAAFAVSLGALADSAGELLRALAAEGPAETA